jgi:RimJ/RimL family protein N-acetyltransferase
VSPRPIEFPVEGLSDSVVLVRPPSDADVPRIVEACRDPEVARYTTMPADYRPTHAEEWMHRGAAGLAAGSDVNAVIAEADGGDVLGTISLHEINRATGRAVAGYLVAPWARRRGIASRALALICGFAFDQLQIARVELAIEPGNDASRAVAETVGFREEGLLRSYLPIAGARRNMLMYALLPGEINPPRRESAATLEG